MEERRALTPRADECDEMDLDHVTLIIDPRSVHLLRFILEAYDNLFILTTLDQQKGVVEVAMARGEGDALEVIVEELADKIGVRRESPK